ncbi:MAG: DUF4249 domain-containing protein [Cyclobacteriaceae bacterium]|nr:DUF4249 domain-containing protein [Cyclobacteriaceae bacterium]
MSYHKIYSYLLLIVALSGGCVQEFDPPAQGYENLLVVEAFLSNEDEPFEVRLSRSVPIDTSAFVPESGAQITLSERDGATFVLSEKRTGVYQSSGMIAAQAGRTYQLQIKTASARATCQTKW